MIETLHLLYSILYHLIGYIFQFRSLARNADCELWEKCYPMTM